MIYDRVKQQRNSEPFMPVWSYPLGVSWSFPGSNSTHCKTNKLPKRIASYTSSSCKVEAQENVLVGAPPSNSVSRASIQAPRLALTLTLRTLTGSTAGWHGVPATGHI